MSVTTFFTRVDSAQMGGQVAALASITIVCPPQSCAFAWRGSLSLDRQGPVFGQGCTNSYVLLLKPANLLSNSTSKRASDVAPWGSICLAYAISSTMQEKVACVTHESPTALLICFQFFHVYFSTGLSLALISSLDLKDLKRAGQYLLIIRKLQGCSATSFLPL